MTVRKGLQAAMWSSMEIGLRQAAQLLITIVLARLLLPEDFGVAALLVFMASTVIAIMQNGVALALVTTRETSQAQETTVFWINVALALAIGLLLVAAGPALGRFYGQPILGPLLLVVAVQILLHALGTVQTALFTRALGFRSLAVAGVGGTVCGGIAAIIAAFAGAGVWALALQYVVSTAVSTALLWLMSGWRPAGRPDFAATLPLVHFGSYTSLSSLLEVVYSQGFALLIGKLYGMRDVGLFSRAQNTQFMPASLIALVITRIAIPLFSARLDDPAALQRGLRLANRLAMIINLPVMAGVAVLSAPIMVTLFGPQWLEAAPIATILAASGILLPLHTVNLQLLLARGDSRTFFEIEVKKKSLGVLLVLAGSYFGIYGVAWAQMIFYILVLPLNTRPTAQAIGYGLVAQLRDLADIIFAAAVMTGALLLLGRLLVLPPALYLLVAVPAGALVYAAVGFGLRLPSFVALHAHVRDNLLRREAGAGESGAVNG